MRDNYCNGKKQVVKLSRAEIVTMLTEEHSKAVAAGNERLVAMFDNVLRYYSGACSQYRKNVEKGYQYLRFAGGQQCWIPQHYADEIRKVPIKRRYLAEVRKENGRIKFLRVHTFAKDGTSAEFEIKYSYKNIPTDLAENKV